MTIAPLPLESPFGEIERIHEAQQKNRAAVAATTAAQRIAKLRRLHDAMLAHRDEIRAAMWEDFRKPPTEVDLAEIYAVVGEARHAMRHLRKWMRPHRVGTRLPLIGTRSRIAYEPKGAVLVISPWNFPFNLTFGPLVSAIAAGNCAMLKPSELTPASAACMKRIASELFDENEVAVIEGGASVAEALLRMKFDHIFFTGSAGVGRLVMKAAAENLTSVTLELGGKSPFIVDETADLDKAARVAAWGKSFNSGQTCVAPDYALVHESIHAEFIEKFREQMQKLGGSTSRGIVVNDRHAERVKRLHDEAVAQGAAVSAGGAIRGREIEPTVLTNVASGAAIMREEIFGPLLPVTTYRTLDELFQLIEERENPLALYVFTRSRKRAKEILARTRSGGAVINHAMIHFYELHLPFGGVGQSGAGKAHGFFGFQAFSNPRGVLEQRLPFSSMELLYPPYGGKLQKKIVDLMLRWL